MSEHSLCGTPNCHKPPAHAVTVCSPLGHMTIHLCESHSANFYVQLVYDDDACHHEKNSHAT